MAELLEKMGTKDVRMIVCTVSNAWKGMFLHKRSGKVTHLTTNQRWVQGEVRALEIDTQQISTRKRFPTCRRTRSPRGKCRYAYQSNREIKS